MTAGCCAVFSDKTGLGCCMDMDAYKQVELAEVISREHRHCSDVPCFVIFIVAILLEVLIVLSAYNEGADARLITDGYDYNVTMCELVVWPSLNEYNIRICIPESQSCDQFTNDPHNNMMIDTYPSKKFLNSYCIPQDLNELTDTDFDQKFDSTGQSLERSLMDIQTAIWLIVVICIIAVLCSFIYIKIIAFVGRFLMCFAAVIIVGGGGVLACFLISNGIDDMENAETKTLGKWETGCGAAVVIIVVILLLITWFQRKNIELVTEMLEESSTALTQLPATLLIPIFMSIFILVVSFAFVVEFAYIYSVQLEVGPNPMPREFVDNGNYGEEYWYLEFDPVMGEELACHVLIWLYIIQFIMYLEFMTLAGVYSAWYFSEWTDESRTKKELKQKWPICASLWMILRYHLGSIAFAALILTVIRVIRAVVKYIESKVVDSTGSLGRCVFACINVCLYCCQCIFDKINKNGLIFVTIYGNSYCYSSYSAFKLVLENIESSVMLSAVTTSSEILGKVMISGGLTAISVLIMHYMEYFKNNLSSYLLPAVVILIICYIIAALFMYVFEVATETIYLSYLIDEKVHGEAIFATKKFAEIKQIQKQKSMEHNVSSQEDVDEETLL